MNNMQVFADGNGQFLRFGNKGWEKVVDAFCFVYEGNGGADSSRFLISLCLSPPLLPPWDPFGHG